MTTFWCPSDILITSWLFTAWWSSWPGNQLVPCVAELVKSCIPIHAHRCLPDPKVPLLCIWSIAVPLCRPLLPGPSRWHGSLPRHGLWWLTCELHFSPLPWGLGSVYQLWKSPLLSCVPWSSDRTSCLSLQRMSWDQLSSRSRATSSCKQSRRDQDADGHRNVVIR